MVTHAAGDSLFTGTEDKRLAPGLPDIATDPTNGATQMLLTVGLNDSNDEVDPTTLLVIITLINVISTLVFMPTNCMITLGFLQISTKNQPMFLFFVGVQFICIVDLVACLVDVVFLWVDVPHWLCRICGGKSMVSFIFLTFLLAAICFYR